MKIMNQKISLSIVAAGIFFVMGSLSAEEAVKQSSQEKKAVQTECPVLGGKINKSLFVDYQGKRIYVCCSGCIGKVKADPEKYIKALEAKGIVLDETPKEKSSTGSKDVEKKEGDHAGHQH